MNVTSPQEMESDISRFEDAIGKFERQFVKSEKGESYYHLVIVGEYDRKTCDEVEQQYTIAGWHNVKCRTSSEAGERPGLTGLMLYKEPKINK